MNSRAEQAYEMRLSGSTPAEIADELGYHSGSDVTKAINERLKIETQHLTETGRAGILQMEMDRLDRLQAKLWPGAMMGDPKSAEAVLKVMDRRIKITGLDSVDTATQQHTVLVVGGKEADYISSLKQLTESD